MSISSSMGRPGVEQEFERLAQDLRSQMRAARERISDRYAKLMEERSFEPKKTPDA